METIIYYIYEVLGIKAGATKDWANRRQYNFNKYGIEPVIIETIEGPDNEEMWQIVGDREWELADERGYPRGTHYLVMMHSTLAAQTPEARSKMSEAHKGKPKSAETRAKQSATQKGRTIPAETCAKMSEAHKGKEGYWKGKTQPKVTCHHCGKTGGVSNMKRWHFDNCKQKTT